MSLFHVVALASSDIKRTYDFYNSINLMPVQLKEIQTPESSWTLCNLGSTICFFEEGRKDEIFQDLSAGQATGSSIVCINVNSKKELEQVLLRLQKSCVAAKSIGKIELKNWNRLALYFKDPDGNAFEVSCPN